MAELLTCPHGHQWRSSPPDPPTTAHSVTCPVCAAVLPWDEAVGRTGTSEQLTGAGLPPRRLEPEENTPVLNVPSAVAEGPTLRGGSARRIAAVAAPIAAAIPGYEILGELGRGGMGVVYQARQRGLNRVVAIKMILAAAHAGTKERTRFRQEAEVVAQLHHPNVVQIFEVGEADGRPFFSLEFVAGGSLAGQLDGTPWPARQAVQLVAKLAAAIHAAHKLGIVHRDLKPGNVLLDADGTPKITDFGLAKRIDDGAGPTQSGSILGTPSYMAPEQATGKVHAIGPAADVYALGAILYELLTGRPPFRAESPMETLLQVTKQEPVPPRRLQPKVPRDLETICLKCLQKTPSHRYPSAQELTDDLERFLNGEPIRARPAGPIERGVKLIRRQPWAAGLAVPIIVLLGGVVAAWLSNDPVLALIFLIVPVTLIGFSGILWQWERAQAEKNRAEEQRHQAEAARREAEEHRQKAEAARRDAEEQARKAAAALTAAEGNLYCLQIALAERELFTAHVRRAEELLAGCPKPLRHWEWHYLKRLCHGELATFRGHSRPVLHLAFSPDGRHLVSVGWDAGLFVWEVATGQLVRRQVGHTNQVSCVAFSPDGRWMASGGGDQNILLWDAATAEQLQVLQGHGWSILGLAFSPRGRSLASVGGDQVVRLWDAATGKPTGVLRGHTREVTSVAYSPDGRLIASASGDGTVRVWDAVAAQETLTLQGHTGPVFSVAFAPTQPLLASGGEDRTVRVWDLTTGREIAAYRGHDGTIKSVAFAPDGRRLASGGWDCTAKIWDSATGQELATLRGHTGIVTAVAFRPDGRRLASASEDKTVKLWEVEGASESRCLRGHGNAVLTVALSPDGLHLISGSGRPLGNAPGEAKLWDLKAFQEIPLLAGTSGSILVAAVHPRGNRFACADEAGNLSVWNRMGKLQWTQRIHARAIVGVAYTPDGASLVTASEDGLAKVSRAENGVEVLTVRANLGPLVSMALNPDGWRLALAGRDPVKNRSEVRLFDTTNGREVLNLGQFSAAVLGMAFRPDGQMLAVASRDGTVKLFATDTGWAGRTLRGHTGDVAAVAFTPDGKRLASAGHDRTVKLWEVETGQEILTLKGHTAEVAAVAFSGNGHRLASASMDQTIRLWDATPAESDKTAAKPLAALPSGNDATRADPRRVSESANAKAARGPHPPDRP